MKLEIKEYFDLVEQLNTQAMSWGAYTEICARCAELRKDISNEEIKNAEEELKTAQTENFY